MPKQTFYNLKEEKRKKIEQALLKEFSNNTFEGASISNIIAEAQIPRGSFYQYFENKEDAVEYIINKYLKKEKEKIYTSLLRNNGDIFKTSIDIYDYIIEKINTTSNLKLFKNILQELRKNNTNAFEENTEFLSEKKTIEKIIDKRDLNIQEKEELEYFLCEIVEIKDGSRRLLGKAEFSMPARAYVPEIAVLAEYGEIRIVAEISKRQN